MAYKDIFSKLAAGKSITNPISLSSEAQKENSKAILTPQISPQNSDSQQLWPKIYQEKKKQKSSPWSIRELEISV